jgi:hypothetical protein
MKEESEESFQVLLTEFFNQTLQVHCKTKPFLAKISDIYMYFCMQIQCRVRLRMKFLHNFTDAPVVSAPNHSLGPLPAPLL